MRRSWADQLRRYAELGGTLIVQEVPGWYTDLSDGGGLHEWETPKGEGAPVTVAFGKLSGVDFRYYTRGAVTKVRVVEDHVLTTGMGDGEWVEIPAGEDAANFSLLAFPVRAGEGKVLVECEHEACEYDGVAYRRHGTKSGPYPLVTINEVGAGVVLRQYACTSLPSVLGSERFEIFARNVVEWVRESYSHSATQK